MALQKRKKTAYLYKSQRVDGRVTNQYLGRTPEAIQQAQADAARAAAEQAAQQRFDHLIQILDDHERVLRTLMHANLILNGYYLHHYQWRKKHVKTKKTPPPQPPQS